jgi:hypothetical protein
MPAAPEFLVARPWDGVIVVWKNKMPFCVLKTTVKDGKAVMKYSFETPDPEGEEGASYFIVGGDVMGLWKLSEDNKARMEMQYTEEPDEDDWRMLTASKPAPKLLSLLVDISKKTGK